MHLRYDPCEVVKPREFDIPGLVLFDALAFAISSDLPAVCSSLSPLLPFRLAHSTLLTLSPSPRALLLCSLACPLVSCWQLLGVWFLPDAPLGFFTFYPLFPICHNSGLVLPSLVWPILRRILLLFVKNIEPYLLLRLGSYIYLYSPISYLSLSLDLFSPLCSSPRLLKPLSRFVQRTFILSHFWCSLPAAPRFPLLQVLAASALHHDPAYQLVFSQP